VKHFLRHTKGNEIAIFLCNEIDFVMNHFISGFCFFSYDARGFSKEPFSIKAIKLFKVL
jgi:hypothetical protein